MSMDPDELLITWLWPYGPVITSFHLLIDNHLNYVLILTIHVTAVVVFMYVLSFKVLIGVIINILV